MFSKTEFIIWNYVLAKIIVQKFYRILKAKF